MNAVREVFWELTLIVGTILMFRGGWTLLDHWDFANTVGFLTWSLVAGILLSIAALKQLIRSDEGSPGKR